MMSPRRPSALCVWVTKFFPLVEQATALLGDCEATRFLRESLSSQETSLGTAFMPGFLRPRLCGMGCDSARCFRRRNSTARRWADLSRRH